MLLFYFFLFVQSSYAYTPVLLWHGMGDSCCSDHSLGKIINLLKSELPGVTVLSLKFGNSVTEDVKSGYFANALDLVDDACATIGADPDFRKGYNAVGFSQGGQFLRALAQRCPLPPMKNLISLGGQHQGIYGLPHCGQPEPFYCDYIRRLLNHAAYIGWVQNSLIQAQYWHDPLNEDSYHKYSIFLADINNMKDEINETYIQNLQSLSALVLVKFENDTMVSPPESSWFGFFTPGQGTTVQTMQETDVYIKNTIGLQELNNRGSLYFLSVPGDHLQFSEKWFTDNIIQGFLYN